MINLRHLLMSFVGRCWRITAEAQCANCWKLLSEMELKLRKKKLTPALFDRMRTFQSVTGSSPPAEGRLPNRARAPTPDEAQLPMRLTACTPCFRAEAGAAGKDTRGMIRQHQFTKVELVSITTPEQSRDEHERMLACAEEV